MLLDPDPFSLYESGSRRAKSMRLHAYPDPVLLLLPSPHVELMVSHAEGENSLVDPQPRGKEHKVRRLLVDWLKEKNTFVKIFSTYERKLIKISTKTRL
jgi:GrpB-like predicted nucleotidyltransferase (UPF0157 family)